MGQLHKRFLQVTILVAALPYVMSECKPGTFREEANNEQGFICKPCLEGTFSDKPNMTQCEECKNGTFSDKPNMTQCEDCWLVPNDDPYVEEVEPCQPDRDTVVKCKRQDFCLRRDLKTCKQCKNCEEADDNNNDINNPTTASPISSKATEDSSHQNEIDTPDNSHQDEIDTPDNSHQDEIDTSEESCIDPNELAWNVKERAIFCLDDEIKLGQSCTGKAYVICKNRDGWSGKFALTISAIVSICPVFLAVFCMNPLWTRFVGRQFRRSWQAIARLFH